MLRRFFCCLLLAVSALGIASADIVLLGDISYQPGDPITGLTDIVLDNFTDAPDLGCSPVYPACPGVNISGTLNFMYLDSMSNSKSTTITIGSTSPGSTAIYQFDPSQITFVSAVLNGTISPASFQVNDGNTFDSTGSFTSDTLTADPGFAGISVMGTEVSAVPEPARGYIVLLILMAVCALVWRSRSAKS